MSQAGGGVIIKAIKENINIQVLSLCELLIGVLLLIDPVGFTSGIIIALGAVGLVVGIISAVSYFRTEPEAAARQQTLAKGLGFSVLGIFCMLRSEWFIITFPILTILYGIAILISGIMKVQWTVDMLRLNKKSWMYCGASAVLSLLFAIIIFANPFSSTRILWVFVALSLIIGAGLDIASSVINKEKTAANGEEK